MRKKDKLIFLLFHSVSKHYLIPHLFLLSQILCHKSSVINLEFKKNPQPTEITNTIERERTKSPNYTLALVRNSEEFAYLTIPSSQVNPETQNFIHLVPQDISQRSQKHGQKGTQDHLVPDWSKPTGKL